MCQRQTVIDTDDFLWEPHRPSVSWAPMISVMAPSTQRGTLLRVLFMLLSHFFLFLPLSFSAVDGAELLHPITEGGVCKSIDIRNSVELFKQLEDCQVIEGFLHILLFDTENETDFSNLSFPMLVEITDYLLLFRVKGLKSVGKLFPNLAVIRGQHLFAGEKALVIFEMPSLQDVNLFSLTRVLNGKIYIDKNPSLCFVTTIDWSKITGSDLNVYVKSNKPENECPVCPPKVNGKACPQHPKDNNKYLCWDREHCQKICPKCTQRACNDFGECCDERCMGSCGNDVTKCAVCNEFIFNTGEDESSNCVQKCPAKYLGFLDRRCVKKDECINMTKPVDLETSESVASEHPYKVFNETCVFDCPPNYFGQDEDHTCIKCENEICKKECPGARIDSVNLAKPLRGCTHITGNVEIQIRGGNQVVKTLKENLGMIEEIDGYVKVVRSFSLINLNFFQKLRVIRGKTLENGQYSLVVLDNQNLQDLFDWDTHTTFRIENGRLFFHFNPKLCTEKIKELRIKANLPEHSDVEISNISNGDKVACNISKLNVNVSKITSNSAILEWKAFDLEDTRKLLSYVVYSREAPKRDVNVFDGRDACGQDNWRVDDVANRPDQIINHTLAPLKPYTQYAFFIKTYTIASEEQGAQSDIIYFTTKSSRPSEPTDLQVLGASSDSLKISWHPPKNPNGEIDYYLVTGRKFPFVQLPDRDYCRDGVRTEPPKVTSTVAPKKIPECPEGNKGVNRKLIDEQEEQSRIDFENALQNKVYIKRTRRSIDTIIDKDTVNATRSLPELSQPIHRQFNSSYSKSDNYTLENITEPGSNFWKSFSFVVDKSEMSITVDNLQHYQVYEINLYACRSKEKAEAAADVCGESNSDTGSTHPKKEADNIRNITIVNITSNSVTVQWAQPPDPNRMIVAVNFFYRREDSQNSQLAKACISYRDFKNFTSDGKYLVHTISDLYPGNYSLYMRASSLYGLGDESEHLVFYIPEGRSNAVLIFTLVGAFILLVALFGWLYYKRVQTVRASLERLNPTVNIDYFPSIYVADEWELPRKNVELIRELGQGSFGMVWEGIGHDFKGLPGNHRCAVKTVNEHATKRERIEFLYEASVMKAFNTTHVVKLLGVVSLGQPALVVMELMVNGDLKTYLRSHRPENNEGKPPPTLQQILRMAAEIADGMAYLEGKKFVHRDLAARNCMVAEDLTVKIGDFGMTRDIYETDYYRKGTKGLLPVRWMSPESLKDGVFSSSSDTWSYGVVLWEMATLASQPYPGLSNDQVLRFIIEGGVMERPDNCPDKLYEVMRICWNLVAARRPSFMTLCGMFLADAGENFPQVSFYHSEEGAEIRAIRAAAEAAKATAGEGAEGDDADVLMPLNALPPEGDEHLVGEEVFTGSGRSDSIQGVHGDPNPRFYSISGGRTANGYAGRARNGNTQSQC